MLDVTNNDTVAWLSERLDILTNSLSSNDDTSRQVQISDLPNVAFFVDSGSFENLPAFFQVQWILIHHCSKKCLINIMDYLKNAIMI